MKIIRKKKIIQTKNRINRRRRKVSYLKRSELKKKNKNSRIFIFANAVVIVTSEH